MSSSASRHDWTGALVSPGQAKQSEWWSQQLQFIMTTAGIDQRPEHCKVVKCFRGEPEMLPQEHDHTDSLYEAPLESF